MKKRNTIGFWWERLGEKPLTRPRHRWKDNIETELKETELYGIY